LFRDNHAFLADGPAGLKVYSLESPAKPEFVYSFPVQGGFATGLTTEEEYVFLAVDHKGIYPFDVLDIRNIIYAGTDDPDNESQGIQGDPTFQALSIAAVSKTQHGSRLFINYVTSDDFGLQKFKVVGNANIQQGGMFETPGEATLSQVLGAIPRVIVGTLTGHPEIVQAKIWARIWYMIFGTILFAGLFVLYLIIFSQFVLPVQTIREGLKAITRLYSSLMGEHGPVVFVKEGHIIARHDELERRGPGVARVDLNSAIVFEKRALLQPQYRQRYNRYIKRTEGSGKKIPRARVEGPGVHFIEPYESIHGIADLRPQFRIRPGVQAYTRDGIEFQNPVWILFALGQPPNVVDVTYEGNRTAENLRVIHFSEVDIPMRERPQTMGQVDAQYYERYQATRRYFQKVKEQISQIEIEEIDVENQEQSLFERIR